MSITLNEGQIRVPSLPRQLVRAVPLAAFLASFYLDRAGVPEQVLRPYSTGLAIACTLQLVLYVGLLVWRRFGLKDVITITATIGRRDGQSKGKSLHVIDSDDETR